MLKRVYYLLATLLIVALLAPAALPTALAAPVHQEEQTIVDIATGDERFSTLVDLLTQAELVETLQGEGPFTVFAPTNEAFESLPDEIMSELQNNPERLTNTLLYHVVDGRVTSADAARIQEVPTMQGPSLEINIEEGADEAELITVNGAEVLEADIEAANGLIHVINDVLLPPLETEAQPAEPDRTIVDIVTSDDRFGILADLLSQAALVETLQGEGPYTVFAPTDEAFTNLAPEILAELENNPERLRNTLLYHVADGYILTAEAADLGSITTLQGPSLELNPQDADPFVINEGVELVEANIEATNGVIHVINDVLFPPLEEGTETDGVDTAETSDTLIAACIEDYVVQADDWLSRLALRYYDDALFYAAIYEATNVAAEEDTTYAAIEDPDLIEIGQTVCIPSERDAQAIMSGVTTLDEGTPADEPSPAAEEFVDEEISTTDAEMTDETMAEPTTDQTIVDVIIEDGRFDTLVQTIQSANLVEMLESDGPFTLFAPTDEAFTNLPEGMLGELLADEVALQDVLLYHVIDGRATSADVIRMDAAPTLEGTSAAVVYDADQELLMVGNGTVIEEDIQAANGVIHVVDSVLLPPTDPNPVDEIE